MASAHDINLNDPAVARLMGTESGIVSPGQPKNELVQIAGDMDHGMMSTTRLDLGKHEIIVAVGPSPSDGVLTVDVYAIVGEPLKIHIVCPRCKHQLTIDGDKKPIDYDRLAENPLPRSYKNDLPLELARKAVYGKLSVQTFQCTWELEDQMQDAGKDVHVIAGGSLCRFRGAIDKNVLKVGG